MTVLIAYGSIEGQTAKIAKYAEKLVTDAGEEAVMFDTSDLTEEFSFRDRNIDKVILAAPVHERRHPQDFEVFVTANQDRLDERPTLLLSVSMSAAFPEGMEEAGEYVEEMKMRTELDPDHVMLVAGAVHASSYDYYASQVLRHVVLRGRDIDPAVQEHEFTDWDALGDGIAAFLEGKEPSSAL